MITHMWLITYDHSHMIDHMWSLTHDHSHMIVHTWLFTWLLTHDWSHILWEGPLFDRSLKAELIVHIWLLTYDCSHMIVHIWLFTCDHSILKQTYTTKTHSLQAWQLLRDWLYGPTSTTLHLCRLHNFQKTNTDQHVVVSKCLWRLDSAPNHLTLLLQYNIYQYM